jgi:hypothetical protein
MLLLLCYVWSGEKQAFGGEISEEEKNHLLHQGRFALSCGMNLKIPMLIAR